MTFTPNQLRQTTRYSYVYTVDLLATTTVFTQACNQCFLLYLSHFNWTVAGVGLEADAIRVIGRRRGRGEGGAPLVAN